MTRYSVGTKQETNIVHIIYYTNKTERTRKKPQATGRLHHSRKKFKTKGKENYEAKRVPEFSCARDERTKTLFNSCITKLDTLGDEQLEIGCEALYR